MRNRTALLGLTIAALFAIVSSAAAPDRPARVKTVITLDVGPNMQKFSELVRRRMAIEKSLHTTGVPTFWVSTYSGTSVGHVTVTVDYPSLASMARSSEIMDRSEEITKWEADFEASGIKVLSESLVEELQLQP